MLGASNNEIWDYHWNKDDEIVLLFEKIFLLKQNCKMIIKMYA